MGLVVALGEPAHVQGFALAGAALARADDPESVRGAWSELGDEVSVVILSRAAADALRDRRDHERILRVVMDP